MPAAPARPSRLKPGPTQDLELFRFTPADETPALSGVRSPPHPRWAWFSDILIRFTQEVGVEKRGAKYHRERLGEALREEIETIVEGELGDPRIGLVSVTSVVLAQDSRSAQVFVTLEGDDEEAQRSLEGLTAAVGFIRREVAENLHLRRPPELYFHLDRSDQYGARIDELLGRTRKKK
jgi:ribosome-binding factor A